MSSSHIITLIYAVIATIIAIYLTINSITIWIAIKKLRNITENAGKEEKEKIINFAELNAQKMSVQKIVKRIENKEHLFKKEKDDGTTTQSSRLPLVSKKI